MLYQRSLDIERRLDDVLRLICAGGYSARGMAQALGVSIPTVSRDVLALRERGHDIRSQRRTNGWCYVIGTVRKDPPRVPLTTPDQNGRTGPRARLRHGLRQAVRS